MLHAVEKWYEFHNSNSVLMKLKENAFQVICLNSEKGNKYTVLVRFFYLLASYKIKSQKIEDYNY